MTAAICWQSVCCNYWSNTNQTIIYWLLHFLIFFSCSSFTWGKKYIHYRRPIAVYNVITRWISVFSGIMTLIIICHQNDNDHDHQWDETLRMIPVASESIRFYMSTYSAHYILMCIATLAARRAAIKVSWHQVKNINTKFAMLCLLHKARNYLSIKRITHKVQFQGKWKFSISLEFVNQVKCLTVH